MFQSLSEKLATVLLFVVIPSFAFSQFPDGPEIMPTEPPRPSYPGEIISIDPFQIVPGEPANPSWIVDRTTLLNDRPTHRRVGARYDLVNPSQSAPEMVMIDPNDNRQVIVRWTGGNPECFGAHAKVEETPESVRVVLVKGGLPEARNRACTMIALQLEMVVRLQQPLASRQLVTAEVGGLQPIPEGVPIPMEPQPNEPKPGNLPDANSYINLRLDQAILRAKKAGQRYRITSIDGEGFPMTMDYLKDRVNFTVEDGIVTNCTAG